MRGPNDPCPLCSRQDRDDLAEARGLLERANPVPGMLLHRDIEAFLKRTEPADE